MKRHSEIRPVEYSAEQMFDLVSDIESYPEFIPWCSAAIIRKRRALESGIQLEADLVVSFKIYRERMSSLVTLDRKRHMIDIEYVKGPLKAMSSRWKFEPRPTGCNLSFELEFEFKSKLLRTVVALFFAEAMQRVVSAFEERARILYGSNRLDSTDMV